MADRTVLEIEQVDGRTHGGVRTLVRTKGLRQSMKRLWLTMLPTMLLLAACEDEGNPGDDNLLTGGSLIVVLVIVAIVVILLMRRRR
jgi:hypothetical protein